MGETKRSPLASIPGLLTETPSPGESPRARLPGLLWGREGEGGLRDIFYSDGGTRMDDRAVSDISTSEEQEQGQEERAKFRCEMLAERY